MSQFILQNIILPEIGLCTEESLYYNISKDNGYQGVIVNLNKSSINLTAGSVIKFDTFFNVFSLSKWLTHSSLNNLFVGYNLEGTALLSIIKINVTGRVDTIQQHEISGNGSVEINLVDHQYTKGILYLQIQAITQCCLYKFNYYTNLTEQINVKLGIVITTFKREKAVLESIQRLHNNLLSDTFYSKYITLYVIDNGQTLENPYPDTIHLIKNENLGGSGGFARGLYELTEQDSGYTHCLFMDDDAACEIDAIRRTFAMLVLAKDSGLSIAGSMFLNDNPSDLWEAGARVNFGSYLHGLKRHLPIDEQEGLLDFDKEEHIDYAGWWYYAFAISATDSYPFPFFVRGDDVVFSRSNPRHKVITLNGVCSWQDGFMSKVNPMTEYLSYRAHLLFCNYFHGDYHIFIFRHIIKVVFSYRYEEASTCILALRDYHSGIDFWKQNLDMVAKRAQINSMTRAERWSTDTYNEMLAIHDIEEYTYTSSIIKKLIVLVTLNGNLLPNFFMKKRALMVHYNYIYSLTPCFRRSVVYFYNPEQQTAIKLVRSRMQMYKMLKEIFVCALTCLPKVKQMSEHYTKNMPELMTRNFWGKVFKEDKVV